MNFKQFLGLNSFNKLSNGEELSHSDKYSKIVLALGYENVKKCVPYSPDEIKKAIVEDKYLNTLPIKKWDIAAGFRTDGSQCILIGSRLTGLYNRIGVTSYSCADGVCILKECARMMCER